MADDKDPIDAIRAALRDLIGSERFDEASKRANNQFDHAMLRQKDLVEELIVVDKIPLSLITAALGLAFCSALQTVPMPQRAIIMTVHTEMLMRLS